MLRSFGLVHAHIHSLRCLYVFCSPPKKIAMHDLPKLQSQAISWMSIQEHTVLRVVSI